MSSSSATSSIEARRRRLSSSQIEALLDICIAIVVTMASIVAIAIWPPFGILATFILTLVVVVVMPTSVPVIVICAFLYQNLIVAWLTPYVSSNETFDALRGSNFVILMTAFALFFFASLQQRARAIIELRPWFFLSIALGGVIGFYLLIGVVRGDPRDAVVYFRNTIIPLACFYIALIAASLYRIDIRRSLRWLAALAIVYGYAELTFTMNFLGLFHGDLYIERGITRQIETGVWEKALRDTGYVFLGLQDVMTANFFNTSFFGDALPKVFRIGGPNFHPISFAYALSIMSAWLLFRGHWLLPLAALPLLLVIGSKGAMFMLLVALGARLIYRPASANFTLAGVVLISVAWSLAAVLYGMTYGDYHVLGLIAGIRAFLANPLGQGLGLGGNLSTTSFNLSWDQAQAAGAASLPVESAVGVMLYQMGIGSFVFFGFLMAIAFVARRLLLTTRNPEFLFAFVSVITLSANAVLQEEAFYSPLALGFCLLLAGLSLGTYYREAQPRRKRPQPSEI